jgi:hypothetical protein
MTIIDQRILIPAGPEVVWEQISDIANNPKWQADCRSISFLTSVREGPGIRWRSTNAAGRESVLEITTWYDRIGYEYTYVDGAPFRESKGRFRLQEIAEGTVVQWTFTYEMGGLVGNVRNSLSVRRQIENNMIDSLKSLWRHVNQSGGSQPFHEAKSLMRSALDYEERSKYRPRHPSALTEHKHLPEEFIPEPPIAEDDTRPRPALAIPADQPVTSEPDFLQEETRAPHADEAWMPKPSSEKPRDTQERKVFGAAPEFAPPPVVSFEAPPAKTDTQPNQSIFEEAPKPPPTPADAGLMQPLRDISKLDTAQISIWEVFGVPRPSETQEIQPIKTETISAPVPQVEKTPSPEPETKVEETALPEAAIEPVIALESNERVVAMPIPVPTPTPPSSVADAPIVGLRIVMRRKLVKLRRVR